MQDKLIPTLPIIPETVDKFELSRMRRSEAQKGKKQSTETKEKRAASIRERAASRTPEEKATVSANISAALTGIKRSEEFILKNSESQKKVWKKKKEEGFSHSLITCTICGFTGGQTSTKRWHFEKCKFNDGELIKKLEQAFLNGPMPNLNGQDTWQETAREFGLNSRDLIKYIEDVRDYINDRGGRRNP